MDVAIPSASFYLFLLKCQSVSPERERDSTGPVFNIPAATFSRRRRALPVSTPRRHWRQILPPFGCRCGAVRPPAVAAAVDATGPAAWATDDERVDDGFRSVQLVRHALDEAGRPERRWWTPDLFSHVRCVRLLFNKLCLSKFKLNIFNSDTLLWTNQFIRQTKLIEKSG
jgi:hypothetical protein